jgi:hypothetical protein
MKTTKLSLPLSFLLTLQTSLGFALTNPPSQSPLFSADSVVQLELTSDFVKIRKSGDGSFAEAVDGKDDPKYYSPMILKDLANPGRAFTGQDRARGNSSLGEYEAQFPKLKIEIADTEDLKGTIFQGARNFRINTHVNTNPKEKYTRRGRLNSENVPWREHLAYQLAEALGLPTPARRLARIHYIDKGSKTDFTRNAMLIETDKKIAERLGATQIDGFTYSQDEKTGMNPLAAAIFLSFHKMIGNEDVELRVNEKVIAPNDFYRPLYNAMVFEYPDKKRIPMVYDLDFATAIIGYEVFEKGVFVNGEFNLHHHENSMFATKFAVLRQKLPHAAVVQAVAYIKSRKDSLYQTVNAAQVDDEGRKLALKHLDTFFATVDAVMNYQMIAERGVSFYQDSNQTESLLKLEPFSEEEASLRAGTPVIVLGKKNGFLKVAILDINSDLQDSAKHIGYIKEDTKLSNVLPDDLTGIVDQRSFGGEGA